jgi:hypothetical protein
MFSNEFFEDRHSEWEINYEAPTRILAAYRNDSDNYVIHFDEHALIPSNNKGNNIRHIESRRERYE